MKSVANRAVWALLVCLLLVAASLVPALAYNTYPLQTTDTEASNALDYLRGQQTSSGDIDGFAASAWVTMAIAAAGEDPHDWSTSPGANPTIVDYLESNVASATTATDYERMVMAITAAGEDPSDFGDTDFLGLVQTAYDGTQIGDDKLLNDDYWGILALISAGVSQNDAEVANTVAFIKANQSTTDGGWSWSAGGDSDVDDTAAAIMALMAAGEDEASSAITNGLAYIKSMQIDNGGFNSWGSTNCDTDAWAIMAIAAAGQDPTDTAWQSGTGNDPVDDLLTFQQPDGSFYWQSSTPGMSEQKTTASAIQALLGKPWPTNGYTTTVRIEKTGSTLFSGEVTVYASQVYCSSGTTHTLLKPTALGALDKASQIGDFSYEATDAYGSPYVTSIDGEAAAGVAGWLYWVDFYSPSVGAGDFALGVTTPPAAPHEEVLWAYAEYGQPPLQIASSRYAGLEIGEEFTITVTDESGPIEGATVYVDDTAQAELTGTNGQITLSLEAEGAVQIRADKDGSIRSKSIAVTTEEGTEPPPSGSDSGSVDLSATISPAIAITVSPTSMVFESELYGNLGPRDTSDPETLSVNNVGTWTLDITTEITSTSDMLFQQGIHVDGALWDVYLREDLARSQTMDASVTLVVPETYSETGEKTGVLIVWAAEAA